MGRKMIYFYQINAIGQDYLHGENISLKPFDAKGEREREREIANTIHSDRRT